MNFHRILKLFRPRVLVRLTYPVKYPSPSEAIKHLDLAIRCLKKQGNQGVWFLSFQQRGAPFFWLALSKYVPKDSFAQKWFEIVGSGDQAHFQSGVSINGFHFAKGIDQFLEKSIVPVMKNPDFQYGTFGNLKATILSCF